MPILRSAFIALSRNQPLRHFSERSALGRRMSSRFVAGMEIEDVLRAAHSLQTQGIASTLDSLGENVSTPEQARHSAEIYHHLLDAIAERKLNANISVKLTQMGMDLGHGLATEIVSDSSTMPLRRIPSFAWTWRAVNIPRPRLIWCGRCMLNRRTAAMSAL